MAHQKSRRCSVVVFRSVLCISSRSLIELDNGVVGEQTARWLGVDPGGIVKTYPEAVIART